MDRTLSALRCVLKVPVSGSLMLKPSSIYCVWFSAPPSKCSSPFGTLQHSRHQRHGITQIMGGRIGNVEDFLSGQAALGISLVDVDGEGADFTSTDSEVFRT